MPKRIDKSIPKAILEKARRKRLRARRDFAGYSLEDGLDILVDAEEYMLRTYNRGWDNPLAYNLDVYWQDESIRQAYAILCELKWELVELQIQKPF